jgi:hypothetical protein
MSCGLGRTFRRPNSPRRASDETTGCCPGRSGRANNF